jgi:hypothetical protein
VKQDASLACTLGAGEVADPLPAFRLLVPGLLAVVTRPLLVAACCFALVFLLALVFAFALAFLLAFLALWQSPEVKVWKGSETFWSGSLDCSTWAISAWYRTSLAPR